jgi:hypothetical protein
MKRLNNVTGSLKNIFTILNSAGKQACNDQTDHCVKTVL